MDITALTTGYNPFEIIYYSLLVVVTVFLSGWFLNSRLKSVSKDEFERVDNEMAEMKTRLEKVENEAVTVSMYERDSQAVRELVTEIRSEVRDGFASITSRIDTLFSFKNKV